MIEIELNDKGITVTGHAPRPDGVPAGQNIICAAVSALTQTLLESLRQVAHVDLKNVAVSKGYVSALWPDQLLNQKARALIDSYMIGITAISRDYPGNITII